MTTDALAFPSPNAAYRVWFWAIDITTGLPLAGAFTYTSTGARVSIDGGAFAATSGTIQQVGTTGSGYVDLIAAEMNGSAINISFTITNANVAVRPITLLTSGVAQVQSGLATSSAMATGFASILAAIGAGFNWNAVAVEQVGAPTTYIGYVMRLAQLAGNAWVRQGASQISFKADDVTPAFTSVVQDGQTSATRSKYS